MFVNFLLLKKRFTTIVTKISEYVRMLLGCKTKLEHLRLIHHHEIHISSLVRSSPYIVIY